MLVDQETELGECDRGDKLAERRKEESVPQSKIKNITRNYVPTKIAILNHSF